MFMSPLNECLYSVFVVDKMFGSFNIEHKYFHLFVCFCRGEREFQYWMAGENLFKYEVHKPCSNSTTKQRTLAFAYFGGFKFNRNIKAL